MKGVAHLVSACVDVSWGCERTLPRQYPTPRPTFRIVKSGCDCWEWYSFIRTRLLMRRPICAEGCQSAPWVSVNLCMVCVCEYVSVWSHCCVWGRMSLCVSGCMCLCVSLCLGGCLCVSWSVGLFVCLCPCKWGHCNAFYFYSLLCLKFESTYYRRIEWTWWHHWH